MRRTLQSAILSIVLGALPLLAQTGPSRHVRAIIPNRYTVMLADAPVSSHFATREDMQTSAAAAYRLRIKAAQTSLTAEIEARGMHVTGSVTDLLNALFVTAPASRAAELQSLTGVTAVRPMRVFKPTLNAAVQAMNAPAAWNLVGGQSNAGAGIKIGIIDTGIDQTHPAFQDASLTIPSGFPKCTAGYPADCAYTNNKVIVARSYVRQLAMENVTAANNPAPESHPDDYSPRDRVGHGTATASCAAGYTNTGAASALAGGLVTFNGMAPKAYLGNYKVSGSPGVNDGSSDDILIQAVEDAVSDGMDIVSISFGTIATSSAAGDPVATAYQAAAQKVVVVAAAGDDGDDTFETTGIYPYTNSISSPGSAPSAISVGATINSHIFNSAVDVSASGAAANLKNIPAQEGDSIRVQAGNGAMIAPLVDVTTLGNDGFACSALPPASLFMAIALIENGSSCPISTKAINAQTAGAIGIIFYMSASGALVRPTGIGGDFIGPTVMIANSDGLNLKAYIDASPGKPATIDYSGIEQTDAVFSTEYDISPPLALNQIASYSSAGPTPDGMIKPDMVATGGDDHFYTAGQRGMYMAVQSYDPNGSIFSANRYASADGTSFAAPMVAGAAALIKQEHPGYSPAQIKSALVNFASQTTTTDDFDDPVDVQRIGGGRLDAGAAAAATIQAQPSTLSFGYLTSALPPAQRVTLTNTGSNAVALAVAVAPNSTVSGTSITATPSSITLAAGATGTISVSVTGTLPVAGEYSGGVTLTGSGVSLRLPYMYLVGEGVSGLSNANVNPISSFVAGYPGQDGGSLILQVVDQFGVPIAGTPVTFSTSSPGALTFASYGFGEPACGAGTTAGSVACNTDQFGFAYAEATLGPAQGTALINMTAGGTTILGEADIAPQPTITQGGVLNDATFQGTIAPGSYIAIYGTNLLGAGNLSSYAIYNQLTYDSANSSNSPTDGSLPLQIDYTSVSFDVPSAGISVPGYIAFVSQTQVNVWVPWELAGQSSVQMKVNVDEGFWGNVVTVPLSSAAPGFFLSGNAAAAQDQKGNPITASNPAVPGQIIVLYCNGLGPVTNQPADGAPASSTQLSSTTTTPVVTIGGQPAQVIFSGLTPGFVGLYQVNATVPAGLSAGNQPITIAIGGQTSPTQTAGSAPQTIVLPVK